MTNELEKQFFDTLGIEPKLKTFAIKQDEQGELTYPPIYEYPQISDHILLELICLCPYLDEVFFTDVEQLKDTLLTSYIKIYKYYTEVERLSYCGKELKHQVRTLFEEG